MDVKVTEKAKSRLHDMGISDEVFLRIGVTSGGCSGNTYDAVLDDDMKEVDDVYYEEGPLRIVSDKVSSIYLDGLTIEYSDDNIPQRIDAIVLSTQHDDFDKSDGVMLAKIKSDIVSILIPRVEA